MESRNIHVNKIFALDRTRQHSGGNQCRESWNLRPHPVPSQSAPAARQVMVNKRDINLILKYPLNWHPSAANSSPDPQEIQQGILSTLQYCTKIMRRMLEKTEWKGRSPTELKAREMLPSPLLPPSLLDPVKEEEAWRSVDVPASPQCLWWHRDNSDTKESEKGREAKIRKLYKRRGKIF